MDFRSAYIEEYQKLEELINEAAQESMARHNYAWHPEKFDISNYLERSVIRYDLVSEMIQNASSENKANLKVCEVGGFYGAFPLALRRIGYEVDMVEKFEYYEPYLTEVRANIEAAGVNIMDEDWVSEHQSSSKKYDIITCLAVLEHLPSSPQILMQNLKDHLIDDGMVILEVPNVASIDKRIRLLKGRSVLPSIMDIHKSEIPFIGHHHEYTLSELEWLIKESGFRINDIKTHNYSYSKLRSSIYSLLPDSFQEVFVISANL